MATLNQNRNQSKQESSIFRESKFYKSVSLKKTDLDILDKVLSNGTFFVALSHSLRTKPISAAS